MSEEVKQNYSVKANSFVDVPMTDVVKQTLYQKYETAMKTQRELFFQKLRKPGKMNSNTEAVFKSQVIDLLNELAPKFKAKEEYKQYSTLPQMFLTKLPTTDECFLLLIYCGQFLDDSKITEIFLQKQSGVSSFNKR